MIYFKYEWISIIKVYSSFISQTNVVSSELCITRALRDLSSLLLLEPQLLWSQSLLHLTKGETRESVKDCTWGFEGLVAGSCTYYFHHHSTGQNPIIRSHLFAREAGTCSLPMCQGRKWSGFICHIHIQVKLFCLTFCYQWSDLKSNRIGFIGRFSHWLAIWLWAIYINFLSLIFLLCLNWIEYYWKLSNMNYMKNLAEFLV